MRHYDVLIVGAGHGGAQTAIALRQRQFSGSIGLINAEAEPPYERPPLSKEYFSGDKSFERILIRPAAFWPERAIDLISPVSITAVDPVGHTVMLSDGTGLEYGKLIWAAGAHARRLTCQGHDLVGVHTLRSRVDVDKLTSELTALQQVIVIGGGYIGLEAAAVLRSHGKQVTVLEAQGRVLARVAGEALSRFYEAQHRRHGVTVLLNSVVECIEEQDGRVAGVRLADGTHIKAQMVIVGIGIVPSTGPLQAIGIAGTAGVPVDEFCRTSAPDVFAIGDCVLHHNAFAAAPIRLESVQNATDMAQVVAKGLTGAMESYQSVPWFWSNQYDLKLQTVGLSAGHDATVVRGKLDSRSFSVIYLKSGRVMALDCVNSPKDFMQGRALVANRVAINPTVLADTAIPLREAAAQTATATA